MSVLATGYSFGSVSEPADLVTGFNLLLGYHNNIIIHTLRSVYILIENTLVKQKMAKTSAWHCVTRIKSICALDQVMGFIASSAYTEEEDDNEEELVQNVVLPFSG